MLSDSKTGVCCRVSIKLDIRKMGFPQINYVRERIIEESDRYHNSVLETLRDVKIRFIS